jgi:molecular chaperone GrpE
MDFKDDEASREKMEKPAPPEAKPAAPGTGEVLDSPPESPDGGAPPADHDQKKHDKGDHEETRSLKGKLKKKDHDIKNLRKEVEELKTELRDLKDKYLRAAAEMDNQRKRLEREKNDFYQFALAELLKELLAVLDNLDRALKSKDGRTDVQRLHEGIELIRKQFMDLLAKRGVTPLDADKKKFDPSVHQAVLTEESDAVTEPEVGEILQTGYRLNERLLRPALVKVVVPKKN